MSTLPEVVALLDADSRRRETLERAAAHRAGLVAAAIYNVHRRKGRPPFKASDFVRERIIRDPEKAVQIMKAWAGSQNAGAGR